jgi:hypothetical protein
MAAAAPCYLDLLNDELAGMCFAFLDGPDLGRLACTATRWNKRASDSQLWTEILRERFGGLGASLHKRALEFEQEPELGGQSAGMGAAARMKQAYSVSAEMSATSPVKWVRPRLGNANRKSANGTLFAV